MKQVFFSDDVQRVCQELGHRLRTLRVQQLHEKQEVMAARIGVSRRTYAKMEAGDPTVKIGYWLEAAKVTHSLKQWHDLYARGTSLFDSIKPSDKKPIKRVRS